MSGTRFSGASSSIGTKMSCVDGASPLSGSAMYTLQATA